MAETLISPGVLARENDQSQVPVNTVNQRGAAIIGPTVKGPINLPTYVFSYAEYVSKFGTTFISGGQNQTYLTSIAANNYFQNGGRSLLVTRVVSSSNWTSATSTAISNGTTATSAISATASYSASVSANAFNGSPVFRVANAGVNYFFIPTASGTWADDTDGTEQFYYFASGSSFSASFNNLASKINVNLSGLTVTTGSSNAAATVLIFSGSSTWFNASFTTGSNFDTANSHSIQATLGGGVASVGSNAFTLKTISQGTIMNSDSTEASGSLPSGSIDNLRWQIVNSNTGSGTFDLIIRRGDDVSGINPIVLEQFPGLSLDPLSSNYIAKVIGDQVQSLSGGYITTTGNYPNKSNYVYVSQVNVTTPNYYDASGLPRSIYTSSLPVNNSGSFSGATGSPSASINLYEAITAGNTQGLVAASYTTALTALTNKDDYQFNILLTPGLTSTDHGSVISSCISNATDRGDFIYVTDLALYNSTVSNIVDASKARNSSYAATYWPWVQTVDPDSGRNVWVPASTMIGGVYANTDRLAAPWFAPAGVNRGGLDSVIRAEKKLTNNDRDALYAANVNPIATFPGTGVVVYGQKTLQKKPSALDRVNVRRLLVELKSFISQVANNLVFESNSTATRNAFLGQVNPYLQSIQERQGLYTFKVVMDDSNNTSAVIDRNMLVGAIYLQPTKTAEFIYLDFNVTPTGATFPA
jgi:hypothetical protein